MLRLIILFEFAVKIYFSPLFFQNQISYFSTTFSEWI